MRKPLLAVATAIALFSAGVRPSAAADAAAIKVENAWARATIGAAKSGAIYVTIVNGGKTDDRLTGITTSIAARAELHTTLREGGVVKMRPLEAMDVKAGETVSLVPSDGHIMLMELSHPLKEGDSFPITLTFEKAGNIEATVEVSRSGAMVPPGTGDDNDMGDKMGDEMNDGMGHDMDQGPDHPMPPMKHGTY